MPTPLSTETQIELLIRGQQELVLDLAESEKRNHEALRSINQHHEIAMDAANKRIAALEDERNKALRWGILSLGSVVMGMAYWIFDKIIGGHIR